MAAIVTDHLPLGNEDAWQKGNGAKAGNSGFMYRVTMGRQDQISIDCGKARGAPKAKSYTGTIVSERYGADNKGRDVLVLDINLPGRSGLDVLHALKDEGSPVKVLVVSMYPEDQ